MTAVTSGNAGHLPNIVGIGFYAQAHVGLSDSRTPRRENNRLLSHRRGKASLDVISMVCHQACEQGLGDANAPRPAIRVSP